MKASDVTGATIVAIAIGAPQARFESVVQAAAPVVDSIDSAFREGTGSMEAGNRPANSERTC